MWQAAMGDIWCGKTSTLSSDAAWLEGCPATRGPLVGYRRWDVPVKLLILFRLFLCTSSSINFPHRNSHYRRHFSSISHMLWHFFFLKRMFHSIKLIPPQGICISGVGWPLLLSSWMSSKCSPGRAADTWSHWIWCYLGQIKSVKFTCNLIYCFWVILTFWLHKCKVKTAFTGNLFLKIKQHMPDPCSTDAL